MEPSKVLFCCLKDPAQFNKQKLFELTNSNIVQIVYLEKVKNQNEY